MVQQNCFTDSKHSSLDIKGDVLTLNFVFRSPVHVEGISSSNAGDEPRQRRGHRCRLRPYGHAKHDPVRSQQVRHQGHDGIPLHRTEAKLPEEQGAHDDRLPLRDRHRIRPWRQDQVSRIAQHRARQGCREANHIQPETRSCHRLPAPHLLLHPADRSSPSGPRSASPPRLHRHRHRR